MRVHPATEIVPLLEGSAFEALKADISANGQQIPIAVWKGQVVDGRNRLRACEELNIPPKLVDVASLPGGSPTMYVLSANLHRRHLSPSQLAMVGARAREHFDAEAKLRQARKGVTHEVRGDARDLAGRAVGVSGKTIDFASKVLKTGVPELVAACDAGKLAVSRASRLAGLPVESQRQSVTTGKKPASSLLGPSASPDPRRMRGAGFDQLVVQARDVAQLLGSLGSAKDLVDSGQFDRVVVFSAVKQLEAAAAAIHSWTRAARGDLGAPASCAETALKRPGDLRSSFAAASPEPAA